MLIEGPIQKIETLFRLLNKDITNELSIQDYIVTKVAGVLNINMIQNFLGSIMSTLGNHYCSNILNYVYHFFLSEGSASFF